MTNKIIINFTPTGIIPTKSQTPLVPITPEEIAEDVFKACELGITTVHLHARNDDCSPAYSAERYAEIISKIRKYEKDLVICVSLTGREVTEFEKRVAPLYLENELKPDMASLTLSSLNFNKQASINSPKTIMDIAALMQEMSVKPELEAFDIGMINYAKYLIKKGYITSPYFFNLILGNIACAQANLLHTGMMINDLPDNSFYTLGGIGANQLKMNSIAISIGAGIRIGIEDNIWYDTERTKLASNPDLLKRTKIIIEANEKEVMKPSEFRKLLNLKEGNGSYGDNSLANKAFAPDLV